MNIYVGNLPKEVSETEVRDAFQTYGQVDSVTILKDKYSGESRGFGFVEMPSDTEANAAIEGLNGKDLKGRTLTVNEARPRSHDRERGGGGAGGGGGGGNRRSGGGGDRRGGGGRRRTW